MSAVSICPRVETLSLTTPLSCLAHSVHYCEQEKSHVVREYRDATSIMIGVESGKERGRKGPSLEDNVLGSDPLSTARSVHAGGRPLLPTQTVYPNKVGACSFCLSLQELDLTLREHSGPELGPGLPLTSHLLLLPPEQGWAPAGDGVRPLDLQRPSAGDHPGDAGKGPPGSDAPLHRPHPRVRPRGQGKASGPLPERCLKPDRAMVR